MGENNPASLGSNFIPEIFGAVCFATGAKGTGVVGVKRKVIHSSNIVVLAEQKFDATA